MSIMNGSKGSINIWLLTITALIIGVSIGIAGAYFYIHSGSNIFGLETKTQNHDEKLSSEALEKSNMIRKAVLENVILIKEPTTITTTTDSDGNEFNSIEFYSKNPLILRNGEKINPKFITRKFNIDGYYKVIKLFGMGKIKIGENSLKIIQDNENWVVWITEEKGIYGISGHTLKLDEMYNIKKPSVEDKKTKP